MGYCPHWSGPDPMVSTYSPQRDVLSRDFWLIWQVNAGASWPFLLQNYIWPCPKGKDHNPLVIPTYIHLKSHYPYLFAKAKDLMPENVNSK